MKEVKTDKVHVIPRSRPRDRHAGFIQAIEAARRYSPSSDVNEMLDRLLSAADDFDVTFEVAP